MDFVPIVAQLFLLGLEGLPVGPGGMPFATGRKQLLTLPGRTLFKSLSCSKELCCLILFFLNMFNVACLMLPPAASLFTAGLCDVSLCGKGAIQIAQRLYHCVGACARPRRPHSLSNWHSSNLRGRSRSLHGGTLLMPCTEK